MLLDFCYDMRWDYSVPIKNHCYLLRCIPCDTNRQRITDFSIKIEPAVHPMSCTDAFSNHILYGTIPTEHDSFCIRISGSAHTGLAPEEYHIPREPFEDLYKTQSVYTRPGEHIKHLYSMLYPRVRSMTVYDSALFIMNEVYEFLSYSPGSTDIKTPAEKAMAKRLGVCQDFAHIYISLCRMFHIPARYVVGMITGEGASHAWAEIYSKGYWYGMDVTNNSLIDGNYIKISHGRDYRDCIVSKGIFNNFALQTQTVKVSVTVK